MLPDADTGETVWEMQVSSCNYAVATSLFILFLFIYFFKGVLSYIFLD